MGEREAMTSLGTCTQRTPSGRTGQATSSVSTTAVSGACHRMASSSSFTPSEMPSLQVRR